jgi:hypothetical protein
LKKFLKAALLVFAIAFVIAQFIRPNRTNPPIHAAQVLQMPADVRTIFDRSCADCHSNNTTWPWYTNVSPVSWWIWNHVRVGRSELNVSEFNTYSQRKAAHKMEEICEMVQKGEMPLIGYEPLHPTAKLSDADKSRLCEWAKGEEKRLTGG